MKNLFWTLLIMLVAFTQTKAGFINGTMTHQNKVRKRVKEFSNNNLIEDNISIMFIINSLLSSANNNH